MPHPQPTGYSRLQIRLHWIVAALIVLQYVLHDSISEAWRTLRRGGEVAFDPLIAAHVFGGIAVLLLVLWRLSVRLKRGAPPPPEQEHPLLKTLAHITHWTLYALMILMPITGAVAWFGGAEGAAEVHEVLRVPLLLLTLLHVAAALFHQFVLKTNLMMRMKKPEA